ncbi:MAG: MraY family glycosyltransferase, partial [bacterium]
MMTIYLTILLSSFFITFMGTPLSILIARSVKLLDIPGRDPLKIHREPIPLLGGLGITSAIYLSLFIASQHFALPHSVMLSLGISLSLIFTIGLIDDYRGLSPKMRLAGQLLAASVFIFVGQYSVNLFQNQVMNSIITIFYVVAATNAMNLLDGIDGLATGTALVASLGFLFGFAIFNNGMGLILSSGCIGACAGFLFYNFNPARIFLGDNGSTVLGFLLGAMAVIFSSNLTSFSYFMFPL